LRRLFYSFAELRLAEVGSHSRGGMLNGIDYHGLHGNMVSRKPDESNIFNFEGPLEQIIIILGHLFPVKYSSPLPRMTILNTRMKKIFKQLVKNKSTDYPV
jgi:hypothetical protein